MKTLDRYLAGIFLRNVGLAVASLTLLFFFQALLGELLDRTYPTDQLLRYHLLGLPDVLVKMAPPAILIATTLTLSSINRTQELVACFSIGIGLPRIAALFLLLITIICSFLLAFQDRVLPLTYRARTDYYWRVMKKREDFFLDVNQDKIWYRSQNLIYNLQRFDARSRTIHGMTVFTFDGDFRLMQVTTAARAEYAAAGDGAWNLRDGTVTLFPITGADFPVSQTFKEKGLLLSETPNDFQEIDREVDGLRLREMWSYLGRLRGAGGDTLGLEVKFHSRVSQSFMPFVMCLLGIPFSTRSRRTTGAAKDLGLCLALTFLYWLFYSVSLSLGTNGALPPWLAAWLPSFLFGAFAMILISRRRA